MKRIGVTYAHYFNKKYERSGHLFQDRFRSEPVDSLEYFVTLLRYIHQNPLKAGIVNPLMVQSLEKSRRNEVLRTMLSLGAGIRQLSRLTGVSFGVIQKLAK